MAVILNGKRYVLKDIMDVNKYILKMNNKWNKILLLRWRWTRLNCNRDPGRTICETNF